MTNIENQITVTNSTCGNCGHTWLTRIGVNPPENIVNETTPNCIICTPPEIPQPKGN